MGEFTFQVETLDAVLADDLEDLLAMHWQEVALDKDNTPLKPNWAAYRQLERAGVLHAMTMRLDGLLIGYDAFFVQPPLHYSTQTWAINDILYVMPEHRRGRAGVQLIQAAERYLAGLGVKKVVYHVKLHAYFGHGKAHATLGRLLKALGYNLVEEVYAKRL